MSNGSLPQPANFPPAPPAPQPAQSLISQQPQDTPEKKKKTWIMVAGAIFAVILLLAAYRFTLGKKSQPKSSLTASSTPTITLIPSLVPSSTPTPSSPSSPSPTSLPTTSSSPTAIPDPMAGWETYTNTKNHFSLNYPPDFETPPENADYGFIGKKILMAIQNYNPLDCRGACPVIEKTSTTKIANLQATKIDGYIGEIGGNIPQRYTEYVFLRDNLFITFTLYARDRDEKNYSSDPEGIWKIEKKDLDLFDQILSTFKFLN